VSRTDLNLLFTVQFCYGSYNSFSALLTVFSGWVIGVAVIYLKSYNIVIFRIFVKIAALLYSPFRYSKTVSIIPSLPLLFIQRSTTITRVESQINRLRQMSRDVTRTHTRLITTACLVLSKSKQPLLARCCGECIKTNHLRNFAWFL